MSGRSNEPGLVERAPKQAAATPGQAGPSLRRWTAWALLACSLAGAGLALHSTQLTHRFARTIVDNPSGCSINQVISCDVVHATSFAWFLGIPVAWWALLFYVWSAGTALAALRAGARRQTPAGLPVTVVLAFGALLFSIYKATHLWHLQVFCPICGAMYLLNLGLLVFGLLSMPQGAVLQSVKGLVLRSAPDTGPPLLHQAALVVAFFSLGYIGIDAYEDRFVDSKNLAVEQALQAHFAQNPRSIPVDGSPLWGNPQGPIAVVVFSEFECPACREVALHFRPLLFEFREDVRFYFKHYPIDTSVNPSARRNLHPHAGLAARAAVCADRFGDFWGFHDQLFRNQAALGRPFYERLAQEHGWDWAAYAGCLDSEASLQRIHADLADAQAAEVVMTPAIFIDGRPLRGWQSPEFARRVLREELRRLVP